MRHNAPPPIEEVLRRPVETATLPELIPVQLPSGITPSDVVAFDKATFAAQSAITDSIPGSRLVPVPNTSHYIQGERPDVVIAAFRATTAGTTMTSTPTSTP
jgi:pimeloyl-ACP methyl ester carboxylesterase